MKELGCLYIFLHTVNTDIVEQVAWLWELGVSVVVSRTVVTSLRRMLWVLAVLLVHSALGSHAQLVECPLPRDSHRVAPGPEWLTGGH